ncbi:calmodulin [Salvia divinorum]|uniref:Calmodulin n=1 Tax=Salvia divinorum TaxID=28513 RepID=A0ABD1GVQ3_SALDI
MTDSLTEEQIAEFREAFGLIDKNSDGVITAEELELAISSLNVQPPKKEEIREMMNEADVDQDGFIDLQEFLTIMAAKMKENVDEEAKQAFTFFDRDKDGFISSVELKDVLINLGEGVSDEEVEEMIKEVDLDRDGLVSYEEFARMMMMMASIS